MPGSPRFTVALLVSAALLCAGCELPHGPLRWDPVQLDFLPHGKLPTHGPFHLTDECTETCSDPCADKRPSHDPHSPEAGESAHAPRLPQHHHAVPLAGPGVNAPWPKFHPVPTRPVFEASCLPPAEAQMPQLLPQQ